MLQGIKIRGFSGEQRCKQVLWFGMSELSCQQQVADFCFILYQFAWGATLLMSYCV